MIPILAILLTFHGFPGFGAPPKRYYWQPPLSTQPIGHLPGGGR